MTLVLPLIQWKPHTVTFTYDVGERTYGMVRFKDGRIRWRNYKRPIRSGVTLADIYEGQQVQARLALSEYLATPMWGGQHDRKPL